MTPVVPSQTFSPNPRRPKKPCRTLCLRTGNIRAKTYELERLANNAGEGTRARINEAVRNAETIIEDVLKKEGRVINAIRSHEHDEDWAARQKRLDVVA